MSILEWLRAARWTSSTLSELGFSHAEFVNARLAYSTKRTVLGGKAQI